jgi:hypothetical protein
MTSDAYAELASVGPYGVRPGHALITLVEPHPGHEYAYNRWYEDDHYNAGAMAFPWMWAGRRYVAPVPHQQVRYPGDSAIAQPIEAGKYISIYWITEGQYENHLRFAVGTNHRLFADGRVFMERDHTFTAFQRYLGPVYRDADGPRDIHSLNYPYGGLVVEVIDANDSDARDQLVEWMHTERVPAADSPVAMGMMFAPMPLPGDKQPYVKDVEGVDNRLTILWFTEGDSLDAWDEFADVGALVDGTGLGRVELMAPFTPTFPGTDRYVDELRAT